LGRKMPVTAVTFLVGVLAIAGTGIPGTSIGLGGFFSKDEILAVAWHRGFGQGHVEESPGGHADAAGAGLTAMAGAWVDASSEAGVVDGGGAAGHGTAAAHAAAQAASPAHANAAAMQGTWIYKLLFILPLIIAYVAPLYMMRAWWMTFMGKPRDHHVHE